MLLGKRDSSTSAKYFPGIDPDHPAIVAGAYVALLLFAVLLHRGALNGGWMGADASELLSVINNPFWRLLFDHDAWKTFADNAFTPVQAGQYRGDLFLFGLHPRGFFLHHLTELAITAIFTYHLLCRRVPRHLSMLATIGFLVAMPTFSVMSFLQNRHYLTGLLLSIGSVYMYQRALCNGRRRNLFISAGLFFLAMLAKELYAVTLLYFLLTSWSTPLFRRISVPYLVSFGIFVAWRGYMLGSFIGGYHSDHVIIEKISSLAIVHRAIFGSDFIAALFLASVATLVLRHRLFGIKQFVGFAALLLALYLPLLFAGIVISFADDAALRLAFFPAWLCAAGLAYIAALLWEKDKRKTAGIMLLGFIAITATVSASRMGEFRSRIFENKAQAEFIRNAGPASALFPSESINGFVWQLQQQLALAEGRAPAGIIQFSDDLFPGFSSYWEYAAACRCMVQLSQSQTLDKSSHLVKLNESIAGAASAPISLLVTWQARQGKVNIVVEPEGDALCLLSVPGIYSFIDCPKSAFPLAKWIPKDKFDLLRALIARTGQDGLKTSTPYMSMPTEGTLQWSRGVFLPVSIRLNVKSVACHIDSPGNREVLLSRDAPLGLRGWILGPSNTRTDAIPLAILAGSSGRRYAANLHREPRPEIKDPTGLAIGGHVLDANLRHVEPGTYRLLLGADDAECDTNVTMTLR